MQRGRSHLRVSSLPFVIVSTLVSGTSSLQLGRRASSISSCPRRLSSRAPGGNQAPSSVSAPFSPRTTTSSRAMTLAASPPTEREEEEIIMLSGYPFYVNGPDPKKVAAVADKTRTVLERAFGDQVKAVDRMGSSAIDGIAGTPVCDILVQLNPWPMTEDAKERMAEEGFEYKGTAPHDPEDEWFFGGDGEPGHLGRVVLHTVPEGSDFVRDMKAFVEYVKAHPDAFQRYNDVKVEGAVLMSKSSSEEGRLLGYKAKKAEVANDIKAEAISWWMAKEQS